MANKLSIQDFGLFQLIYTYFIFIQTAENLAHPNVVKSFFHSQPDKQAQIISACFWMMLFIFCFLYASSLIGSIILQKNELYLLSLLILSQLPKVLLGLMYHFDFKLESQKSQISQLSGNMTMCGFRSTVVHLNSSLTYQALGVIIGNLITTSAWWLYSRSWFSIKFLFSDAKVQINLIKDILRHSMPLWLISLLHFVLFKVDILILGHLGSAADVAIYSNAVRLTEPWSFVAAAVATSFFPVFLAAKKVSTRSYYNQVGFYFRVLLGISTLLAMGLSLFSGLIIQILFDSKYAEVANILRLHAINLIPFFLIVGLQSFDVIENFKRFSILKFFICGLIAIALDFLLIPIWGIYACVFSSFVSYLALAIGLNFAHPRSRKFTILVFRSFKKVGQDWQRLQRLLKSLR